MCDLIPLLCSSAPVPEEEPLNLGGRFSKSAIERERILSLRKERLVQNAVRRYLERQVNTPTPTSSTNDAQPVDGVPPLEADPVDWWFCLYPF